MGIDGKDIQEELPSSWIPSIRSTVTFYMIHPVLWYQAESDVRRHCFSSFQPALAVTAFLAFSLAHMAHSANTEFSSPAVAPARKAGRVHAHCARLRSPYAAQDKPFTSGSTNPDRKGCDILLKINYMSTLFVGIDVSSKSIWQQSARRWWTCRYDR